MARQFLGCLLVQAIVFYLEMLNLRQTQDSRQYCKAKPMPKAPVVPKRTPIYVLYWPQKLLYFSVLTWTGVSKRDRMRWLRWAQNVAQQRLTLHAAMAVINSAASGDAKHKWIKWQADRSQVLLAVANLITFWSLNISEHQITDEEDRSQIFFGKILHEDLISKHNLFLFFQCHPVLLR